MNIILQYLNKRPIDLWAKYQGKNLQNSAP